MYNKAMQATLIIKNIENLYTCDQQFTILKHAFLALFHDKIIKMGTGSFEDLLDPATVVIDARGECVIPAFIDCHYAGFQSVRLGDQLREDHSALYAMKMNGILTLLSPNPALQRKDLTQDVFFTKHQSTLPIVETKMFKECPKFPFLLSCGFGKPNSYVYSFQPMLYQLFNGWNVESQYLLEAMTSLVAKEFHLEDRGSIEIGKIGDLLILHVPSIEHYFQSLGRPLIHRMIKNGIPFYPHWIVC